MPIGGIIEWSGAIIDIPVNWALCDGTQGTPDLRDKFILGAGGAFDPGFTGGSDQHNHHVVGDLHAHGVSSMHGCPGSGGILAWSAGDDLQQTLQTAATGTAISTNHLPPFYALAKIMRIT